MTTTLPERTADIDLSAPPEPGTPRSRWVRLVRGRAEDPAWVRPALLILLVGTALLYLIDLGASGWANSFYSAAVQAGTKSWKAFFFGSSDASNFITVDKPPAALWVMEISGRIFGVSSWSILVPQALEGVASVGLLYLAVRRTFSASAGLLAGAVLALTPVAALMFRFNNPDALLALLLIGATYATIRAVQGGRTSWLLLAGALVGLGFTTKELQALIVLPALGAAYLVAGPVRLRRRLVQLLAAGAAVVVSAGWWVVAVMAVPGADRPYIGGSQDNSEWNLIFGYNGFGRLTGNETGSVGGGFGGRAGGGGGGGMWGQTGITRMFGSEFGSQIAWLLPAALAAIVVGFWLTRRARRSDPARAAFIAWGGGLVVTGLVFSLGKGIIHPYYSVALAPPMAAVLGAGATMLWARRHHPASRIAMAVMVAGTAVWADVLLRRSPTWHPWLQSAVLAAGAVATLLLLLLPLLRQLAGRRIGRFVAAGIAAIAVVASLGVPAAASIATAATPHDGAIPSAAPGSTFGPGGGGPGGRGFGQARGGFGGGGGGLLDASRPSAALTAALKADASHYTWVAATVGSESASGYQLASGEPVMSLGGFNGTDPYPSLAAFEKLVSAGKVHYFIAGGGFGGGGAGGPGAGGGTTSDTSAISSWVESHYTSTTIGATTVYDLTAPASASASTSASTGG